VRTTRDDLLRAAWTVLRDEGPTAATSRRITEVAGANLAAITYHFGSKDALLGAAVGAQLRGWTAPLTAALTDDPDEDVEAHDLRVAAAVASIMARFAVDGADVATFVTLLLSQPELPEIRTAVAGFLADLRAAAAGVMVRQQAIGAVPASVDPPALAGVFTAFALGLVAQAAVDPAAPATPTLVQEFLALLVRPG
jgi:AcrR family transcriptional regulator